jgi:hypothetical protein
MTTRMSREVWSDLDHHAGQLPRRTVVRTRITLIVAVALAVVVGLVWRSGLLVPRLIWSPTAGYGYESHVAGRLITTDVVVHNAGWTPVTLTGAGRSGPGLELVEVVGGFPVELGRAAEVTLVLTYRVTDCAAVTDRPWPVPVHVDRPWGTYTAGIAVPPITRDPDTRQYEWQYALADQVCHPRPW